MRLCQEYRQIEKHELIRSISRLCVLSFAAIRSRFGHKHSALTVCQYWSLAAPRNGAAFFAPTCAVAWHLVDEIKRGRRITGPPHIHSIYFWGEVGQVSNPEQNESVKEAAGPSHNLLPASSKKASGTSSLCKTSSSYSAVARSLIALILSPAPSR